jgi:hypothetical protein
LSPGSRGRPPRSQLVCAERGNPVRGPNLGFGKPTARRAQLPGGNRMAEKRMPVAERQRETHRGRSVLQLIAVDNWPDIGPGARTRKRADAVR